MSTQHDENSQPRTSKRSRRLTIAIFCVLSFLIVWLAFKDALVTETWSIRAANHPFAEVEIALTSRFYRGNKHIDSFAFLEMGLNEKYFLDHGADTISAYEHVPAVDAWVDRGLLEFDESQLHPILGGIYQDDYFYYFPNAGLLIWSEYIPSTQAND